jgi:membrane-associated protein
MRVALVGGAGTAWGGAAASLGLLVLTEAGIPLPVPADLLMLFVGERAAAGSLPLWLAAIALAAVALLGTAAAFLLARGPAQAVLQRLGPRVGLTPPRLERARTTITGRGRPALVVGRATPGLRTLTVVAAATAVPARVAIPLLALGSTVFLEAHLALGYLLGPAARRLVERAGPIVLVVVVLVVVGVLVRAVARRRSRHERIGAVLEWSEAVCPACLVVSAVRAGRLADERENSLAGR